MDNIKIDSPSNCNFSPKCFKALLHHPDPKYAAVSIRLPKTLAHKAFDALSQGDFVKAGLFAQSALILKKGGRV